MAIRKKASRPKARKVTAAPRMIAVSMQAFGNNKVSIQIEAGTTVEDFQKDNIPPGWQVTTMTVAVNGEAVGVGHLLNAGDEISFIPKVTGG